MRVNVEKDASHVAVLMPSVSAAAYRLYTVGNAVLTGSNSCKMSDTVLWTDASK